jgi:hypothetical protein
VTLLLHVAIAFADTDAGSRAAQTSTTATAKPAATGASESSDCSSTDESGAVDTPDDQTANGTSRSAL